MYMIKLPHGPEVSFDSLPTDVQYRLAQYGARQWVQDAIAGYRRDLESKLDPNGERALTDEQVNELLVNAQEDRWEAILNGTVGTRAGGPRLRGIDAYIRDVADAALKVAAAKAGKKLPKGEKYAEIRAKYISLHSDEVRKEAERQMAAVANVADVDSAEEMEELFA